MAVDHRRILEAIEDHASLAARGRTPEYRRYTRLSYGRACVEPIPTRDTSRGKEPTVASIEAIHARQILDSRGNPTLEVLR